MLLAASFCIAKQCCYQVQLIIRSFLHLISSTSFLSLFRGEEVRSCLKGSGGLYLVQLAQRFVLPAFSRQLHCLLFADHFPQIKGFALLRKSRIVLITSIVSDHFSFASQSKHCAVCQNLPKQKFEEADQKLRKLII